MMRRAEGFTLLEVLAAMAVFALVLLALSQGLHFGIQAWRNQSAALIAPAEMQGLDRLLRRIVMQAASVSEVEPASPILGRSNAIVVITRLPRENAATTEPTEVRLEVDRQHRLVMRTVRHPNVTWLVEQRPQVVVLADRIDGVEFEYWQRGRGWLREWVGPGMPALVRIRLRFPAGDLRRWPDIIAAPTLASFSEISAGIGTLHVG